MAIKSFTDHAANERTFLAWVRTGITVMAFGFLVERFDIFLQMAATSLHQRPPSVDGQLFGNVAGLMLIVAGAILIFFAAFRFKGTQAAINAPEVRSGPGTFIDLLLSLMLMVLGIALAVYLIHAFS